MYKRQGIRSSLVIPLLVSLIRVLLSSPKFFLTSSNSSIIKFFKVSLSSSIFCRSIIFETISANSLLRLSCSNPVNRPNLNSNIALAKAILELRLGRLTGLEQDNLSNEFADIVSKIIDLQKILDDKETLKNLMIDELDEVKKNFGDERRTLINDTRRGITNEDLIPCLLYTSPSPRDRH